MHILQEIIQLNESPCQEEELYIRREADGAISYDTYFNAFSIEKWKRYTNITGLGLNIRYSGRAEFRVFSDKILYGKIERKVICTEFVGRIRQNNSSSIDEVMISIPDIPETGIVAFSIKGSADFKLHNAAYIDPTNEKLHVRSSRF